MRPEIRTNTLGLLTRSTSSTPLLVCFSHLRWDFVFQRPQHLLTRAARRYRVFYVEEPVLKAGATPHLDISPRPEGVTVVTPVLPERIGPGQAAREQESLLEALLARAGGGPRVFWYYTPMAVGFTAGLSAEAIVYDNMDELSAFLGAPAELLEQEEDLLRRADLVFTGGISLYEAKRNRHRSVHPFPSSIDAAHFGRARTPGAEPDDMAGIPRPRLGFFGVIDERMDAALVAEAADLRPDWQFVMLGPVVKIDPATLPRRPNLHWLGAKSYAALPGYLGAWDIGLMPFAMNEATRYISPTKTPEFLAAGLPVVSTPIRDVVRTYGDAGLVEIARTAADLVEAAERLMARPRAPWLERVDGFLSGTSWDRTFESMDALVTEALAARTRSGAARRERPLASTGEAHRV